MRTNFFVFLLLAVLLCLTTCSKDKVDDEDTNISLNQSSISLYNESTFQLIGTNVTHWETKNDFVANVDNNGLVTGNHVGTTSIIAKNEKSSAICVVTVLPKIHYLYDTPIIEWGASESTIQSKETHELLKSSSDNTQSMLSYTYKINDKPVIMTYSFENGKLNSVHIIMDISMYSIVPDYLKERYAFVGGTIKDYALVYADSNDKEKITMLVGVEAVNVSGTMVTFISYYPYPKKTSI